MSAVDDVCPYLRADGGEWRSAHPSRAHRCGAIEPPVPLATGKQRSLCLVQAHETCVTYMVARQRTHEAPGPVPTGADLWPETRSTPVLLDPPHAVLVPLAGGQARTGGQALLVGLMVLAFFVLVVARTSPPVEPGSASQGASAGIGTLPSPSASASATASAVPSPTPLPTASPAPTPTVGPTPTSSPSPPPTPTASVRRYTVKSGDTLSGIAVRFATTVKAIKVANGLRDNLIRTGQVLVIP